MAPNHISIATTKHKKILDLADRGASFRGHVLAVTMAIPRGSVLTYAEVARRAGNPRAARAVGSILHANFDPRVPCHRVICADGTPGSYNRGTKKKAALLRAEGALG